MYVWEAIACIGLNVLKKLKKWSSLWWCWCWYIKMNDSFFLSFSHRWYIFSHRWYISYQNYLLASGKRIALVMQATLFLVSSWWWYNIFICNEWVNAFAFHLLYFYILYFACYYWFAKSCLLCFFFARYAY